MRFAKVRFESDEVTAKALLELSKRMRITVLKDESFIVPEPGVQFLKSEDLPHHVVEWLHQDNVVQAIRDSLAHPV